VRAARPSSGARVVVRLATGEQQHDRERVGKRHLRQLVSEGPNDGEIACVDRAAAGIGGGRNRFDVAVDRPAAPSATGRSQRLPWQDVLRLRSGH